MIYVESPSIFLKYKIEWENYFDEWRKKTESKEIIGENVEEAAKYIFQIIAKGFWQSEKDESSCLLNYDFDFYKKIEWF